MNLAPSLGWREVMLLPCDACPDRDPKCRGCPEGDDDERYPFERSCANCYSDQETNYQAREGQ